MLYGYSGRVVAAVSLAAGVLAAFVASAQQANLFSLVPQKYLWFATALPIVSLFLTGFSERIQGGASKPEVRAAARAADEEKGKNSGA
jgi:hypothetical protein